MLSKASFLAEIEGKAASRAEIARVLGVAPPRITEMYKGKRDLTYEEALKLSAAYGVDATEAVNAALLTPTLRVCLRHAPKEWTDQAVERLAQEIEYGLALLQRLTPSGPSQDAVEVAARAIAERFQHKPD